MRRFLILFFALLLPLQFSWGAMARYCAHETGSRTTHIGHHVHAHHASAASGEVAAAQPGSDDPDCSYCHLGSVQPLAHSMPMPVVLKARAHGFPEPLPQSGHHPGGIERPNWPAVA